MLLDIYWAGGNGGPVLRRRELAFCLRSTGSRDPPAVVGLRVTRDSISAAAKRAREMLCSDSDSDSDQAKLVSRALQEQQRQDDAASGSPPSPSLATRRAVSAQGNATHTNKVGLNS